MQSRRGFFQTLLAGVASTLAKSPAAPPRAPANFVRTQMQAKGYYSRIMMPVVSRCEMGTAMGHTAGLLRVDFQ